MAAPSASTLPAASLTTATATTSASTMFLERKDMWNLLVGGISGCVSRTAVSPLERLKILYQVQHITAQTGAAPKYTSMGQAFRTILNEEGARGLYKGNGANCIRIFPYIGIQFGCFEKYKHKLYGGGDASGRLRPEQKLVVGTLAGATSVAMTYPLDLVRGRLTAQGGAVQGGFRYNGVWHALVTITKQEGFLALYSGSKPTIIGIAPYVGINYFVYESLKEAFVPPDLTERKRALTLIMCGAVAGACGQTIAYPFDLLRRRFQMMPAGGKQVYEGILHAFRTIIRTEGTRALYKGYSANFVKVVPSVAIAFTANDLMKSELKKRGLV